MTTAHPAQPSSNVVLRRARDWGALLGLAITVVGALVGFLVAGTSGMIGGIIGGALAIAFAGVTAISILVANRFVASPIYTAVFFAIVMGGWIVKFVVFIVLVALLRGASWLDPMVLFVTLVAAVIASLVVDVVVVARSRMPYVSDAVLPGSQARVEGQNDDSSRADKP